MNIMEKLGAWMTGARKDANMPKGETLVKIFSREESLAILDEEIKKTQDEIEPLNMRLQALREKRAAVSFGFPIGSTIEWGASKKRRGRVVAYSSYWGSPAIDVIPITQDGRECRRQVITDLHNPRLCS